MNEKIVSAFKNPDKHIISSEIIRRYSTNKQDIREIALSGIDLKKIHNVLDLGCGFGFMAQVVSGKVASDALIIGVDACSENSSFFLKSVMESGRKAEFIQYHIRDKLPWADKSFDLIIASYSLYFFPDIVPEIACALNPQGLFVTITHSQDSFSGLYKAAKLCDEGTLISKLVKNFSGGNGQDKLNPCFNSIERIEYDNALQFKNENLNDLLNYAMFKLPFMEPESEIHNRSTSLNIKNNIIETLSSTGHVTIKKSDVIFRCKEPKCK